MLDCDRLNKNSSIEEVDFLYRHSMLGEEADIICQIIESDTSKDIVDIVDEAIYSDYKEELSELKEFVEDKCDEITKAMDRIKLSLTDNQFSKVEDDFGKVLDRIREIANET